MKVALDMQVQRTKQARELNIREEKMIGQRVKEDEKYFNSEQEKKNEASKIRNREHQKHVNEQIENRSKLLRSIGAKVMVGN